MDVRSLWPYLAVLVLGAVLGWLLRHMESAARRVNDENTWRVRARTLEFERNHLMGTVEAAEAEIAALKHQVLEAERRCSDLQAGQGAAPHDQRPADLDEGASDG